MFINQKNKWVLFFILKPLILGLSVLYYYKYSQIITKNSKIKEVYGNYIIYIIIGFVTSFSMKQLFNTEYFQNIYLKFNKKNDSNSGYVDHNSLGDKAYLIIFYGFCSIGYMIFGNNTYYIPSLFGGKDLNIKILEENLHIELPNNGLLFIFYILLGHCIFRSINHIINGKSDILSLIIHHNVTIYLMMFTFCFRFYLLGINISFCNEITDVFLNLGKFLYEAKYYKKIQVFSMIIFYISWMICRNYIFFFNLYINTFYIQYISNDNKTMHFRRLIKTIHIFSFIILTFLVMLNFYWTKKITHLLILELGFNKKVK